MLRTLRNSKLMKVVMVLTSIQIIFGNAVSNFVFANGPSQPEMQGPSAMNVENWVDPFTGDFSYSIPVLDLGDIPLSLNYQAGITMEQEASWVGLGWNLNPGSISRSVRGLPDDFKYDEVIDEMSMRPNKTFTATVGLGKELFGLEKLPGGAVVESDDKMGLGYNLNFSFNNYEGLSVTSSFNQTFKLGQFATVGYSVNSPSPDEFGDVGVNIGINLEKLINRNKESDGDAGRLSTSVNTSFSTTKGLEKVSLNANYTYVSSMLKNPKNGAKSSIGFGGGYNHNMDKTYSPKPQHSFKNYAVAGNVKFGFAFLAADAFINGAVSYSEQKLDESELVKSSKAVGYLYLDNNKEDENLLLDFNRANDGQIYESTDYLSMGYLTYDLFNVSAPGFGGSFRAYRNDIGYIQEPHTKVTSNSGTAGFEASIGNITSPGIDLGYVNVSNSGENWDGTPANSMFQYGIDNTINTPQERVHFAMIGEPTFTDESNYMDDWGGRNAIEMKAENLVGTTSVFTEFKTEGGSYSGIPAASKNRNERVSRNTTISYFTKEEIDRRGLNTKYKICESAKPNHIERIIVTTSDGTRYVYGLPVYNITQQEVSFNVGKDEDCSTIPTPPADNLKTYSATQNTSGNKSGKDWFFHKTTTPAYAHSYMLTEILSPDYVDVTGDGATNDDLGNYVKYSYGIDTDPTEDGEFYEPNVPIFKWRTPFTADAMLGNFYEGLKQDCTDDKVNYVYGEKEIWYLNKIETKRYLAEFIISEPGDGGRHDGYEVAGINGGMDEYPEENLKLSQLDEIRLYSLSDYYYDDPQPIKTVHFKYNYSLCKGYPANSEITEGKLTLEEVYFTYNNSQKSKYNSYTFEYLDNDDVAGYDFPYNFMYSDRWGNYKEPGALSNIEFPYVDQSDPTQANINAAAWCLYKIHTPGGGQIEIEYESDDYAYIHDLPATQLFEIYKFSNEANKNTPAEWTYEMFEGDVGFISNNNFLIFKLSDHLLDIDFDDTQADNYVKNNYILFDDLDPLNPNGIIKNLYFKVLTSTNADGEPSKNEYVTGYCKIDVSDSEYAGAIKGVSDDYEYGYIRLESAEIKHDLDFSEVNPIAKTGWQFTMLNAKKNIVSETFSEDESMENFLSFITKIVPITSLLDMFRNPNEKMVNNGYCKEMVEDHSWVRLKNPYSKKLGGGHRVKQITVFDNWEEMTTDDGVESSYAKEYNYSLKNGESTGVAAYEPALGGDENPKKIGKFYGYDPTKKYKYNFYNETPFGEEFFPAPVVGYSKVTIKNIDIAGVNRTAVGKTVYDHYTTRDYPFQTQATSLEPIIIKSDYSAVAVFPAPYYHMYTASQGFSITTNDMHGKLKKVSNYAEGESEPYSSTEYKFYDDGNKHLISTVNAIDDQNNIDEYELGVTIDHTLDYRSSNTNTIGGNLDLNLDLFLAGAPLPIPFVNAMIGVDVSFERVNTVVSTKVINTIGIISETIVKEEGSTINQKNELWDLNSGTVILTSTQNEFDERYYSLSYPAYWHYDGMGLASKNIGFTFDSKTEDDRFDWNSGLLDDADELYDQLVPGDEILFTVKYSIDADGDIDPGYESYFRAIVYNDGTDAYLIDDYGNPPPFIVAGKTAKEIVGKVFRSGRRNMQTVSMGGLVTRDIPINEEVTHLEVGAGKKIISASASEYSDAWNMLCQSGATPAPIKKCYCDPALTIAGDQFVNFFTAFLGEKYLYQNNTLAIHEFPIDADEAFYYEFTPLLNDLMSNGYNIVDVNIVTDEDDGDIHFDFLNDNLTGREECSFKLSFTGVTDWGLIIDDIFDSPSDPQIEIIVTDEPLSCADVSSFEVSISYTDTEGDIQTLIGVSNEFDCIPLRECTNLTYAPTSCYGSIGEYANPYLRGVLGVWNKKMDYTFLVNRNNNSYSDINSINLKTDGSYESFNKFWNYSSGWNKSGDITGWQWTAQANKHDISVGGIESVNPLNIFTSYSYGLNNTTAEMVCDNSPYKQIGFENFEDDYYLSAIFIKECNSEHFDLTPSIEDGTITSRWAHTGNYSMQLEESGVTSYYLEDLIPEIVTRTTYETPFTISDKDCLPQFSPDKNAETAKKFLIDYWVKETDFINDNVLDAGTKVVFDVTLDEVSILDVGSEKISDPIDGWRRHEYTFTVAEESTGEFEIIFTNTGTGTYPVYIDDIKVQPFEAISMTYVYDNRTQRLMAELDANHYATFYEYDEDGQLIRVKKETERGIMTIQEGRYNLVKK